MKIYQLIVLGAVLLAQQPFFAHGIFLPWSSSKNDSDGFKIPKLLLDMDTAKHPGREKLRELKNITRRVSLDERCFREDLYDMPISFAFHKNVPYTSIHDGKRNLQIRGMFPGLLSDMLDYCCPGGAKKVQFAKLLRKPADAEDRIASEMVNEYDFTFPIHAPATSRSFRDHPFIPLVRVPSVVLLAYDGNERTSKTHAIATTILKAWPIMVFILLTATFSGIIIWFLVSRSVKSNFATYIILCPHCHVTSPLICVNQNFE